MFRLTRYHWRYALLMVLVASTVSPVDAADPAVSSARLYPVAFTSTSQPRAPVLRLPLACVLAEGGCVLARTTDHDPAPAVDQDYRCGPRASNDHDGTDIAVRDMTVAARTAVLAAAAGTVKATRDGMNDLGTRRQPVEALQGQDCGNGVVIDHGNGWETHYCHLRQDSLRVRTGEKVKAGQPLGLVGMSGGSEFPHLHFVVRYQGRSIDPFSGTDGQTACNTTAAPLWNAEALAALPWQPSGFYHAGIASSRPDLTAARDGDYRQMPTADAPALVLWVEILAPRKDDQVHFGITAPDGATVLDQYVTLEKDQAQWFGFAGARPAGDHWPSGSYRAAVSLKQAKDGTVQTLDVPLVIAPAKP